MYTLDQRAVFRERGLSSSRASASSGGVEKGWRRRKPDTGLAGWNSRTGPCDQWMDGRLSQVTFTAACVESRVPTDTLLLV